jgi:hypothetical protein
MRTSARRYLVGLLALAAVGSTASVAWPQTTHYCPQAVVGQWNGIWWHWSLVCPDGSTSAYATSTRAHMTGGTCDNCKDRIGNSYKAREQRKVDSGRGDLVPHPDAKQRKFIPPQKPKGKPGESTDPRDSFDLGKNPFAVAEDWVTMVKDSKGKERFFRLLLIVPDKTVKGAKPIGVGQEMNPNEASTITKEADKIEAYSPGAEFHHIVTAKDGTEWHVTSFKALDSKAVGRARPDPERPTPNPSPRP